MSSHKLLSYNEQERTEELRWEHFRNVVNKYIKQKYNSLTSNKNLDDFTLSFREVEIAIEAYW